MANHGPSYGLDAELERKRMESFDKNQESQVFNWIMSVTGEKFQGMSNLKDGVILCKLANKIRPGSVNIGKSSAPFVQMENIGNFLKFAREIGVPASDLFQTVDLYESKNLNQVVRCLYTISRVSKSVGTFKGPYIN